MRPFDRDIIRYVTPTPRPNSSASRVALLVEADLPGRLPAHVGQSFTGIIEAIAIKRLQDIHTQAVKAGADDYIGKTGQGTCPISKSSR